MWETICTPRELESLADSPRSSRGRIVRVLFSAKESVYKCIYPLTRTLLGFQDVEIELDLGANRFQAGLRAPVGGRPRAEALEGFLLACAGSIVTGVSWPSASPSGEPLSAPLNRTRGRRIAHA